MRIEDKKYVWWGLLGIGVAALFYFLSTSQKKNDGGNLVTVPYLVPQYTSGASPTTDQSLSNQPNIVGSSSNSTIPNFSNPYATSANPMEAPGTYGFMPNLISSSPSGIPGTVQFGSFSQPPNVISQNSVSTPGSTYSAPR